MQQFKSIKKIQLTILNLILVGFVSADPIGSIVEQSGSTQIKRQQEQIKITDEVQPDIQLNDVAETANGKLKIKFLDDAQLDIKEHSEVLIDEIYYDPDPSLSKMSMKFTMGTARFASGSLGLVNKANIDIQTPTATIGIRGTDFTTTIDELGRSLIMLLPDVNGDPSGEITVTNEAGVITLNQAYQATMVSSLNTMPTKPVTIGGITPSMIDNMFIVNPPTEVREAIEEQVNDDSNKDKGILDIDFLEYNELEKDFDDYANDPDYDARNGRIDVDFLAGEFLPDLLDVVEELIKTTVVLGDKQGATGGTAAFKLEGAKLGLNKDSQYNIFLEDSGIVFYRDINGVISLTFEAGAAVNLNTVVDGYEGTITMNGGDDINIYIRQVN
tara:strand:+ start:899 stop:2056 length:1158 start_codon:yes stop_codon:yes gene_type:complete